MNECDNGKSKSTECRQEMRISSTVLAHLNVVENGRLWLEVKFCEKTSREIVKIRDFTCWLIPKVEKDGMITHKGASTLKTSLWWRTGLFLSLELVSKEILVLSLRLLERSLGTVPISAVLWLVVSVIATLSTTGLSISLVAIPSPLTLTLELLLLFVL